jgi:hypothetical protein
LQPLAQVEGEPGLARACLTGPHLDGYVLIGVEPPSQIGHLGSAADQLERSRVWAKQPGLTALLAPARIHGEAERSGAADCNLVALANNLDCDIAVTVDIGALDHGSAKQKPFICSRQSRGTGRVCTPPLQPASHWRVASSAERAPELLCSGWSHQFAITIQASIATIDAR